MLRLAVSSAVSRANGMFAASAAVALNATAVRCCATAPPPVPHPTATPSPASTSTSTPGTTSTVTVDQLSEQDRDLLHRAFTDPASLPKAAKNPMGDSHGAGNIKGEMAAVFTCNICNQRSVKRFSKHAYTKGIVIVQCAGCANKHLLADHMGWFVDDHKTIEEILRAKGEEVKRLHIPVDVESIIADPAAGNSEQQAEAKARDLK